VAQDVQGVLLTKEMDMSRHIHAILKIARCPECHSAAWTQEENAVLCSCCQHRFPIRKCTIDFMGSCKEDDTSTRGRFVYARAHETWGKSLHGVNAHHDVPSNWHHAQFLDIIGKLHDIYKGIALDIGCGSGYDTHLLAERFPDKLHYAVDMGDNIPDVSERDSQYDNAHYIRGDALNLPIVDKSFDSITSFGVFHHTVNPQECMNEAYRVLRKNGCISVYLYKNHEDNLFKHAGVVFENMAMYLTSKLSLKAGKRLCWLISPLILLLFSYPAQLLKLAKRSEKLGMAFPLHWGTTPESIIGDLQDRLLAPVNHRYSSKGFEALFKHAGFSNIQVVTTTSGHYGYAEKYESSV